MKTTKALFGMVLVAGLGLIAVGPLTAQTFKVLHSFAAGAFVPYPPFSITNSDGAQPIGGMILSGNTLYGTTAYGGSSGIGTVFKVNIDGTGFTTLYNGSSEQNWLALPPVCLILSGTILYGTALDAGSSSNGTVFAVKTDGTGSTNLHSFTALSGPDGSGTNSDGAGPTGLILSSNTLYGTTVSGGSGGNGTVFSLTLPPPQMAIIPSRGDVILTWPTNAAGFTLQSTTNLVSSAGWTNVSPAPVVVNGQNAVTNPISGKQKFYRLRQ